jgi:cytochrome c2
MYGQTLNLYGVVGRKVASVAGFEYFRRSAKIGHRLERGEHRYVHHLAEEVVSWHEDGVAGSAG